MIHDNGGPAFPEAPVSIGSLTTGMKHGMTLRDWFAGMAMQALLSRPMAQSDQVADEVNRDNNKAAQWAYECADAMIAKRGNNE